MNQKNSHHVKKDFMEVIQSALKEGIAASMEHEIVFPLSGGFITTLLLGSKIIPTFFDLHILTVIAVSILGGGLIAVILFKFIRFFYKKGIESIYQVSLPIAISSRHKQISRLISRIETGQSGAIIGAFGQERTLILRHINNDRSKLFGHQNERLICSFLDISTLDRECSQAQFWKYVLEPLQDKFAKDSDLFKAYKEFQAQDNEFQNHRYLENIIAQLRIENWRLVLLLDRFETLLIRPQLNCDHFLNSLRALASSHAKSSLSVILTSNAPVWQLHESTTDLSSLSSPHLNFLEHGVITLGVIPETEINKLLNNDRHPFSKNDKQFLKDVSGGHPFLLETAAVILKQTHKDIYGGGSSALVYLLKLIIKNKEEEPIEIARTAFTVRADRMLTDILTFWSPKLGEALISVANQSDISGFSRQVIRELERQGFIKKVNEQWQVRSSVFADLLKEKDCQQKKLSMN